MKKEILDNLDYIKKLDSQNMLGSLELIDKQVEQIVEESKNLQIPADYKNIKNIVVLGMGGSTLGTHIIKSLFFTELKIPLEIINDYNVPGFVNNESLVIVSSYSGSTEEPLRALKEARIRNGKIVSITSGAKLKEFCLDKNIPGLFFSTENNPCSSPRMGLGYLIIGQIIILNKLGLLSVNLNEFKKFQKVIKKYQTIFGIKKSISTNFAKKLAIETENRSVWYIGSDHLSGNVHVGANQMNENAKCFSGYFLIPELNHHLMEGLKFPQSNKKNLLFILIESALYVGFIEKRYKITKEILSKNGIFFISYVCKEKTRLEQVAEILMLTSYSSFYSALLEGIDPTAIPFVDFLKQALAKK